jgi:hypothetical protein
MHHHHIVPRMLMWKQCDDCLMISSEHIIAADNPYFLLKMITGDKT